MRISMIVALTFLASPALAADPCLKADQANEGVIQRVRHQMQNKEWRTFYVLRLPKPVCVLDDEGGRHEKQREIGLFPEDEKQIAGLVGKKVRVTGEGPIVGETQWHIRDLTFMGAKATPAK